MLLSSKQEDIMAKSKSKKRKAEAAKASAPKKQRASVSKIDRVKALCERECGVRLLDIMRELNISKAAASSLIGDLRRKGVDVKLVKREDGEGIYKI
jgi:predicted DNA-binding transcriptional regulator